jgi:hypothetical protein
MDVEGVVALVVGLVFMAVSFGATVFIIAGVWKAFSKAGKPGWAAIIPFYNIVVILEIAGKPVWWIVLFFIPLVNFVVSILISIEVAKAFGRGAGFGLGLAFLGPIFWPILGFGSAEYQGAQSQT